MECMGQVTVDPKPNGMASTLRYVMEQNLALPRVQKKMARFECTAVVKTDYNVSVTVLVQPGGNITLRNGTTVEDPDVVMSGGFQDLADLCSRKLHPLMALLKKRVKVEGPLGTAMRLQRVMILPKEAARGK